VVETTVEVERALILGNNVDGYAEVSGPLNDQKLGVALNVFEHLDASKGGIQGPDQAYCSGLSHDDAVFVSSTHSGDLVALLSRH
jgi:hypothetical protein